MNYFATNLTYCRKVFRVTQENLAIQLNRSQSTIGGWENKVSEPNVDALIKLSEFFGISIDNIIKVDLVNVNPIEFKEMVKKEGNVNLNVNPSVNLMGKEILKKDRKYTISDTPESVVNDGDPSTQWATLKILQQMDQKLDRLLLSAQNKPNKGTP
jgi:transcriptional regulator with XRE-family HTH domain